MNKQKLSQSGYSHVFLPLAAIFIIAGIGTYVMNMSHAATCTSLSFKQGSSGTCVKYIQQLVNWQNKPAYQLTVDGSFGAKTKEAVMVDQKRFSLTTDGVVGPKTWKVICSPQMGPGIPDSFPIAAARAAGCNI